ncbi:MAG TPA: hypothetical protein VGZ22_08395, partial [Isosphaeraceae bacterium]|nr:hypothetical protein [Isosphaeraceae bacterium]
MLESLEERTLLASIPLSSAAWTPIGPAPIANAQLAGNPDVSGRVTGIAADPTNPNIVYLTAAGGGVWKTTDGGLSWTPLTDNQATLSMGAIAVSKSNPQVIYAGTGEANGFPGIPRADIAPSIYYGRGVLKSTDGGATWTLLGNTNFDRRTISKVAIDPTDPNTVFVAVGAAPPTGLPGNTGVWKSTDGGQTWTNTTTSISTSAAFSDLVMDPSNPNILYTAVGTPLGSAANGIYKTTDGGATWAAAGNAPTGVKFGRIAIAISPSSPLVLYASYSDPATQGLSQMLVTKDGGKTWNATQGFPPNYLGGQAFYDTALAVDPTNPSIVYAAGSFNGFNANGFIGQIIVSRDGGGSWSDITVGVDGNGVHPDHHALAFDSAGRLLDGNDGGIWRLDSAVAGAEKWADLNTNLDITQFIGIALDPADATIAYGGSQDNGTEKFTGGLSWNMVQAGDGGYVRVDPKNPQ